MHIRVENGVNRHFAYTDRVSGYIELETAVAAATGRGYFRGERCFVSDFFVANVPVGTATGEPDGVPTGQHDRAPDRTPTGQHDRAPDRTPAGQPASNRSLVDHADLYRTNALHTLIRPEGFSCVFDVGSSPAVASGSGGLLSLDVSLLVGEQAFALSLMNGVGEAAAGNTGATDTQQGVGTAGPARQAEWASQPERASQAETANSTGLGIVFPAGKAQDSTRAGSGEPFWLSYRIEGITIWQNDAGTAIACAAPFALEAVRADRIVLTPISTPTTAGGSAVEPTAGRTSGVPAETAVAGSPTAGSAGAPWYLVFEDDGKAARAKALSLVKKNALAAHNKTVADFLSRCTSNSGNPEFDDAVRWAQFHGWMLVTGDKTRGIWAGLPWFRDNWGRDTFIALPGILLASGLFDEARAVLLGFARHQCTDRSKPEWGRIPNRYRNDTDVIYNTADGTLWFIREVWEYLQYSRDMTILDELDPVLDLAFKADLSLRTDSRGFLLHADADTWMDARISGNEPWSPRGDRANDIQALWYTALRIGSKIAALRGRPEQAHERAEAADRVRESFNRYFWCTERSALADHLPPGDQGEWLRDFSVRPNQLFALSVPSILGTDDALVDPSRAAQMLENVDRELVSPFGLFSLCPDDPLFHPKHENPEWHHKDAAYHNGTIWVWNSGPYVSAACASGDPARSGLLPPKAAALLRNEARMTVASGTLGTLSENIHAECDESGEPVLSGTWSQAWSVSEFARNVYQDVIGFHPRLAEDSILLAPHLPADSDFWSADLRFGPDWKLSVRLERVLDTAAGQAGIRCVARWTTDNPAGPVPPLALNGVRIVPDTELELFFPVSGVLQSPAKNTGRIWCTDPFPKRELEPEWCGSVRRKDFLERLILSNRMNIPNGGPQAASLEWFFDSDWFRKKYNTRLGLGALYSRDMTVFRLWAPTARSVSLVLYPDGNDAPPSAVVPMTAGSLRTGDPGVWELVMQGDLHGTYYRFRVQAHGIVRDTADPAAKTCGVNGKRSMVCDFSRTDPEGWNTVRPPEVSSANDVVAYEVHVADLTSSPAWNGPSALRRTYAGACHTGTTHRGVPTGFDHIRSLGVTHVQLLPIFDYQSVDESRIHDPSYAAQVRGGLFNWGYDPENYNAPEGSYASNPSDGTVRVRELKNLIASCAREGIGVIMDVVYNHVPAAQNNALGVAVPGYYFRVDSYSGAGDDTASERDMFRHYMIDSLVWWLTEYKLSGFRFDLMGLHDVETMNSVLSALRAVKSDVLVYGEGWDMYRGGKMIGASMIETRKMPGIGFFNDAFRCGIKGSVFKEHEGGFIHDGSHRESVKFGLVGTVYHSQVHGHEVDGTANPNPWGDRTAQTVNYTEIHDNSTLFDKLVLVEPDRDDAYYTRLQKTAIGLVLFAQGMPILHAGMEFMRTKEIPSDVLDSVPDLYDLYRTKDGTRAFSHNTYNLCDRINALDWNRCADKQDLVEFVRALIAIRKAHPLFRLRTAAEVTSSLTFIETIPGGDHQPGVGHQPGSGRPHAVPPAHSQMSPLIWRIDSGLTVDTWQSVCLMVNPSVKAVSVKLPECVNGGSWHLVSDGDAVYADLPAVSGPDARLEPKALYLYADF